MLTERAAAKVLAVEDDPGMREFYERFFDHRSGRDFEAKVVGDARDALALLRVEDVDIMILDWTLPGIAGDTLTRALRANVATRKMGILMVSGRRSGEEMVVALKAGVDDFLGKPIEENQLLTRLVSLDARRKAGTTDRPAEVEVPLTLLESNLLHLFLRQPNMPWLRTRLCRELWGQQAASWTQVLDAAVLSLKRKMGPDFGSRLKARGPDNFVLES
jgi:DNA-binding response OmpR family regulator